MWANDLIVMRFLEDAIKKFSCIQAIGMQLFREAKSLGKLLEAIS